MIYFTLFFLLIFIIVYTILEKNLINPVTIFGLIWFVSLFLSSLKLFGMIEVSDKAIILISLGVMSFILGSSLYYIYKIKLEKKANSKESKKYKQQKRNITNVFYKEEINYIFINVLLTIGILIILPLAIKVTSLLLDGVNYADIRAMYYSYGDKESLIKNDMLFTLFDWFSTIILAVTTPIIITSVMMKKANKIAIIELIAFTMLHIYSTAGRSQLFVICIEIVLVYLLNKDKISKKIKNSIRNVLSFTILIITIMSIVRNNSSSDSINQVYAYLSLPAPYFSKLVDYVDSQNANTNGVATFYGPYLIIQKAIKGLTGYKLPYADNYYNIINKPQNYWLRIFNDSKNYYNAYGTMFYNFYLDYKAVGVILFSILYGILMQKVYLDAKHEKTITNQVIYLILTIGLCNSFIRWHFASPTIFISLVLIKLVIEKQKIVKPNTEVKKVLVFGMTENPGGVESVIMNYYRHIDKNKIQFDFLCNSQDVAYEDEILKLGGQIYRVTPRNQSRIKFLKDMNNFFGKKIGEYSAIWVNVCSLANIDYLKYAKKYGIEKRIIHCHNSKNMDSTIRGLLHKWNRIFLKNFATDFWSCSADASTWFYSKEILKSNKYNIIKNAIDCKEYAFNEKIRQEYRKHLNLDNKIVLGNIGRFHFQKNQLFLIDIFYYLHKFNSDFILLLIGDGEDKEKIQEKIHSLNLESSIKILGIRNDVKKILQSIDAFIFPSIFEGLPMVLLETQANGLPIFASESITKDIKMSDNLEFISLSLSAEEWANIILEKYKNTNFARIDNYQDIVKKGYEINNEVKKLESFFERN